MKRKTIWILSTTIVIIVVCAIGLFLTGFASCVTDERGIIPCAQEVQADLARSAAISKLIYDGCITYYDGCNICDRRSELGCTTAYCSSKGEPECYTYGTAQPKK